MGLERQHLEVVLEFKHGADAAPVASWLQRRGLSAVPLVAGLLATGNAGTFRAVFGVDQHGALRVPAELAEQVVRVTVVPPKELHARP